MEEADRTSDNKPTRPIHSEIPSSDEVQTNSLIEPGAHVKNRPSANAESSISSASHVALKQTKRDIEFFHSAIVSEDLATIRNPRLSQAKMADAIRELVRRRGYKSADHGKEYKFRWSDDSTYCLIKYCREIGPFYGFEHLKSPTVKKLERSSFISLKWSCILYDLLMSLEFEGNVVPTETQIKQRYRYLTESMHAKLIAVPTGHQRSSSSLTGAEKVDIMLKRLLKLKNDSEKSRTLLRNRAADQRTKKRTAGQMLCSSSNPCVIESIDHTDSEEKSSTDELRQPVRRSNGSRDFTSYAPSVSKVSEPITEMHKLVQEIVQAVVIERKYREIDLQQKDVELAIRRQELELKVRDYRHEKEMIKQQKFRFDAERLETLVKMMATAKSLGIDDPSFLTFCKSRFISF
ncbi:uncharacterized protein LALA0_S06e07250g [Lachancea lanzarotensis]|uniref:LALA0S06e07250g1_1 n=1 Tax=Lachancea lanzarotensis TaxID=1245769 RepID=A0A0C7NBJ9_9SACH|nr:uncharacterized protein LALA0_S06e07250g [Lachancea lanzarotensis]CEP62933.1 LALA0S06e07250g1_1 [Lachancea lanzarotensis]